MGADRVGGAATVACLESMTTESTGGSTPDQDEQWERLARYIAGESTTAEAEHVGRWLAEDPRRRDLLDALQRSACSLQLTAQPDIDVEAALRRVSTRLDETPVHAIAASRPSAARRSAWRSTLARAAAVVVLLLGAAALVWRSAQDTQTPGATTIADGTFTAPVGAVDSVRLADGTRVLLAPGSRLTVRANDADYVELEGEALFDVAAAAAGRFTVHAGPAVIRDLGTTFSVRRDAAEVRVVVTSGSVVLSVPAAADSAVLRAGDRAVLSPASQLSTERGAASRDDLAWTDGRLVFNNATLAQVAGELRRWYGIHLQFADSTLTARHFTASFHGEDVQRVLEVMALALDVEIERSSGTAIVRKR